MKLQPIADIAEICARKGIRKAVLSPGSRCAPLTLAFVRHPDIETYTISDERSAAFVGLGMALHQCEPVVLVCTSGSAAYNYAPAVAEAYYQQVPLLILTADRPPEWIDQWDGQTIRQQEIYGKHVKRSFQLPVSFDHPDAEWHCQRITSEAINATLSEAPGPVHVNVPLREPFYPSADEAYGYSKVIKVVEETTAPPDLSENLWEALRATWATFDKKLIVAGQSAFDPKLLQALDAFSEKSSCILAGDVISNICIQGQITLHDVFLGINDKKLKASLQPEMLVTFGKSLISKNLKLFLRAYKPKVHWHVAPHGDVGDPFQSLTKVIRSSPEAFFRRMNVPLQKDAFKSQKEENFHKVWHIVEANAAEFIKKFFPREGFGEFEAVNTLLPMLPEGTDLHLANSMAVRYANILGHHLKNVRVFANRGTSGIDGSNSTAVGTALASGSMTTLITGDMAFFYDRNGFWHNYLPENLRIIVLNNHGGGIFRMIHGPAEQPELEEYFETKQALNAHNTATDFGFDYLYAGDSATLKTALQGFFTYSKRPKLLEINTDSKTNQEIFNQYKTLINNNYGQ